MGQVHSCNMDSKYIRWFLNVKFHASENLDLIESYPRIIARRRQIDTKLKSIEISQLRSLNNSIGGFGISASVFVHFTQFIFNKTDHIQNLKIQSLKPVR